MHASADHIESPARPAGVADLRQLSVVVINYNGMDSLPATLESLSAQLPDMAAVVLADDGSTDGSREWVARHYPQVRIVGPAENTGRPTMVRNAGLRVVETPYVFLTDNDILFPADAIQQLLEVVAADETVACAAPRLINGLDPRYIYGDGNRLHFLALSGESARGERVADRPVRPPVQSFAGGIMMLRVSHVREIGFFDEGYLHGWADDAELMVRCRLAGYRSLHVSAVAMLHDDVQHGTQRAVGQFANRYRMLLTVYSGRSLLLLAPSLIVFELISLAGSVATGVFPLQWRAIRHTLRSLPDILRQRRTVQRTRRVRDREFLVAGRFQLPATLLQRRPVAYAYRLLCRAFDLNWWLAARWT